MGIVVRGSKAFKLCHGYKTDHELILWSEGVIGTLNDWQEVKCEKILIENAKGGPKLVDSYVEALKVETVPISRKHLKQMIAIRQCAHILDKAEDVGLIENRYDVYSLMDYCMFKLGFDHVEKPPKEEIKKFVDKELSLIKSNI